MDVAEVEDIAREIAENFHLHIESIIWRQKKSFLSLRMKASKVFISFQDTLHTYPEEFVRALIFVAFSRVTKKTQNPKYHQFLSIIKQNRTSRIIPPLSPILRDPQGDCYHLELIAQKVLEDYRIVFKNYFDTYYVQYKWNNKNTFRKLAYFNPNHHIIVVSPNFDRLEVPQYVLEYLIYHELLHAFLGIVQKKGKRSIHTPEFHRLEKIFMHYELANHFLTQYTKNLHHSRKKTKNS
jgi:predicted metallopeptidase